MLISLYFNTTSIDDIYILPNIKDKYLVTLLIPPSFFNI